MSWPGEKQRHAMSSRGVKTKQVQKIKKALEVTNNLRMEAIKLRGLKVRIPTVTGGNWIVNDAHTVLNLSGKADVIFYVNPINMKTGEVNEAISHAVGINEIEVIETKSAKGFKQPQKQLEQVVQKVFKKTEKDYCNRLPYKITPQGQGEFKTFRLIRQDGLIMKDIFFDRLEDAQSYAEKQNIQITEEGWVD